MRLQITKTHIAARRPENQVELGVAFGEVHDVRQRGSEVLRDRGERGASACDRQRVHACLQADDAGAVGAVEPVDRERQGAWSRPAVEVIPKTFVRSGPATSGPAPINSM